MTPETDTSGGTSGRDARGPRNDGRVEDRMIWLFVLLLLIGVAVALKAGLVAFAGYVLLGVYLLSRWLARRWVHDLSARRECDSAPREVGESTEVTVTLTNTGALPVAWVLVE